MNTETLLRKHFEAAAAQVEVVDTPVEEITGDVRRTRLWISFGSIAAVLLAVVAVVGLMSRDTDDTAGPQPTIAGSGAEEQIAVALPPSFDAATAIPVFTGGGTADEVALSYLEDRVGVPVALLSTEEIESGLFAIRWGWGRAAGIDVSTDEGDLGWVLVRATDGNGGEVLAAVTDGVSFARTTLTDGTLQAIVDAPVSVGSLALDVLDLGGTPVPGAIHPDGYPGADDRFGTAGVSNGTLIEFSTDGIVEPVIIRAYSVGGTLLTVSEFVIEPEQVTVVPETTLPPETQDTVVTSTTTTMPPESGENVWSAADAERDVENFLAALAAGAYEQAAWPVENNGGAFDGQTQDETPAEYLARVCANDACLGPYAVVADGPGLINESAQASSTVTVTPVGGGDSEQFSVFTFEGQRVVVGVPPRASAGEPTLVARLFGGNLPERVVVQRFDAFEIWENGSSEWVTNWRADDTRIIEGDYVAGWSSPVAGLYDPAPVAEATCGTLMTRDGAVLALDQCAESGWVYENLATGAAVTPPIAASTGQDGEWPWFVERGGTTLVGIGDAEGNIVEMTADGVDLVGDDYLSIPVLSVDGSKVAYVDHGDPNAYNHFYSPVVVVKDVATGAEINRWVLDGAVLQLEFSGDWVVAWEADGSVEDLASSVPNQAAVVAINIVTGEINRVETGTRVFLPS